MLWPISASRAFSWEAGIASPRERESVSQVAAGANREHQPVLLDEVLHYLEPQPGGFYVDATVGGGGHAAAVLERSTPGGRLLGLDRDPEALSLAHKRLAAYGDRVRFRAGSFAELPRYLDEIGQARVSGVLADLGLSSMQIGDAVRGFSFSQQGPLDMRFDRSAGTTAGELVNRLGERELADLIFEYGEERKSRAIARRIVAKRPLETTADLRRVVHSVLRPARRGGIDPATRTFQALRIAVNQELDALDAFLQGAARRLEPGGRLVVISYHSLEDRAVKWTFRQKKSGELEHFRVLTPKPVRPSEAEVARNRRARSAKLRALERLS